MFTSSHDIKSCKIYFTNKLATAHWKECSVHKIEQFHPWHFSLMKGLYLIFYEKLVYIWFFTGQVIAHHNCKSSWWADLVEQILIKVKGEILPEEEWIGPGVDHSAPELLFTPVLNACKEKFQDADRWSSAHSSTQPQMLLVLTPVLNTCFRLTLLFRVRR